MDTSFKACVFVWSSCDANKFKNIMYCSFFFPSLGGMEETSGQRYSADPTGLLAERSEKGDKNSMIVKRDKNTSGKINNFEHN